MRLYLYLFIFLLLISSALAISSNQAIDYEIYCTNFGDCTKGVETIDDELYPQVEGHSFLSILSIALKGYFSWLALFLLVLSFFWYRIAKKITPLLLFPFAVTLISLGGRNITYGFMMSFSQVPTLVIGIIYIILILFVALLPFLIQRFSSLQLLKDYFIATPISTVIFSLIIAFLFFPYHDSLVHIQFLVGKYSILASSEQKLMYFLKNLFYLIVLFLPILFGIPCNYLINKFTKTKK